MKSPSTCIHAALLVLLVLALPIAAEDVVLITATQKGMPPQEKRGEIQEYTGAALTLVAAGDRKTQIPAERVLEVRSHWCKAEHAGDELRRQGMLPEALEAYRTALRDERRAWAIRKIKTKLIACYEWNDQPELAGEEFLAILSQDPQTPYFSTIPLAWRTSNPNAALADKARQWLAAKANPAANLLGASWLLAGDERARATNVLQSLTSDLDPRVASLAVAQLWRTKIVTATADDLALWQKQLPRIPVDVQGGPLLLIGLLQQRLKQPEDATVTFLQVSLATNQRETLAIDATLAAAKLLEQLSRPTDAARLYREVLTINPIASKVHKVADRLEAK